MGLFSTGGKASLSTVMTGHAEPTTHRNVADATDLTGGWSAAVG
jgi:hypothetical protein